jgi:NTP pyrophosphatase (non-canonical NTP hydrolase)
MIELQNKIIQWADEKGLSDPASVDGELVTSQYLKLLDKFGDLSNSILKDKSPKEEIGECLVSIIILSKQLNIELDFSKLKDKFLDKKESLLYTTNLLGRLSEYIIILYNSQNFKSTLKILDYVIEGFIYSIMEQLYNLSQIYNLSFEECLQLVYDKIKNIDGVIFEGAFIKSSDPMFQTVCATLAARRVHFYNNF